MYEKKKRNSGPCMYACVDETGFVFSKKPLSRRARYKNKSKQKIPSGKKTNINSVHSWPLDLFASFPRLFVPRSRSPPGGAKA